MTSSYFTHLDPVILKLGLLKPYMVQLCISFYTCLFFSCYTVTFLLFTNIYIVSKYIYFVHLGENNRNLDVPRSITVHMLCFPFKATAPVSAEQITLII